MTAVPHVYQAIANVMSVMASQGISKDRKNEQQGYAFRGIDDVYNTLAPHLAKEGLVILPRCVKRDVIERQTQRGGTLFYVNVDVEFSFVSAKDGSSHIVQMPGEAMDSGDKATNKAMSAAFKYACLQTFCIPTEGDNDADATTHAVAPRAASVPAKQSAAVHALDTKLVGADEVKVITHLASQVGVDLERICAAYEIDSIAALPMKNVAEVIDKLQQKAKAK